MSDATAPKGALANLNAVATGNDLAAFEAANDNAGLLGRYVAGRVRAFPARVLVAFVGILILMLLISPMLGLLAALITLPAELGEHFLLRRLLARADFDAPRTEWLIRGATAMQSIGISVPIFLAGLAAGEMRSIAWAFAVGAAINAMLIARFHPASCRIRVASIICAVALIQIVSAMGGLVSARVLLGETVALGVMLFMLARLFGHIARRENRTVDVERRLLTQSNLAQRLALVAEHAMDSVMLLDPQLRLTWVNPYFTTMTGYGAEEVLGHNPGDFLNHPDTDPDAVAEITRAAEAGQPINLLILNRRKDGSPLWVDVHQTPVRGTNGEVEAFISVERDATERMHARQALSNALEDARRADREKTAFLSRMSHEMRTPANGIVGGAELLVETELDPEQREIAGVIADSASRMMQLVDDILNYSEITSDTVDLHAEPVDITRLLHALGADFRGACRKAGLKIDTASPADLVVQTDPVLLRRLLEKLVSNAIKFTRSGSITVRADYADHTLTITVSDTGIGVSPEDMERIFDGFTQVDMRRTRAQEGAGIGLALARDLARVLGGTIDVASTPGKGSRFVVSLRAPICAHIRQKLRKSNELSLLVAEDNKANRMLIGKMLRGPGHRLDFAVDGEEAVRKYLTGRPDVVLMDISMPRKDGLDATREIRQAESERNLPHCPIVAVTANASDADRQKCIDAGMDGFVAKPLRKARLFETLDSVVGG